MAQAVGRQQIAGRAAPHPPHRSGIAGHRTRNPPRSRCAQPECFQPLERPGRAACWPRVRGCRCRQSAGRARPPRARSAAAFLPRTSAAGWCLHPGSATRRGSGWKPGGQCGCSLRCDQSGLRSRGAIAPGPDCPRPSKACAGSASPQPPRCWPPAPARCPAAPTAACSAAAHPTGVRVFRYGRRAAAPRPGRVAGLAGGPWGPA